MAKDNSPGNVKQTEWNKTIDFFLSERHMSRSTVNFKNRSLMPYLSLHGTCTYIAAQYKKKTMSATQEYPGEIETWGGMHIKKSGDFVNERARTDFLRKYGQRTTNPNRRGRIIIIHK